MKAFGFHPCLRAERTNSSCLFDFLLALVSWHSKSFPNPISPFESLLLSEKKLWLFLHLDFEYEEFLSTKFRTWFLYFWDYLIQATPIKSVYPRGFWRIDRILLSKPSIGSTVFSIWECSTDESAAYALEYHRVVAI